jgi:hypothetical protein
MGLLLDLLRLASGSLLVWLLFVLDTRLDARLGGAR